MSTLAEKVAELKSITGCVGGFVSRDGACLASSLPPVYDAHRLDRVAANVRKLAALADKSGQSGADFVLRYAKANLLVLSLGEGAFLLLACEPSVSLSTVEVFASVAADEIREALAHHQPEPSAPALPIAPEAKPDPAEILEDARQTALALYGAPLATVKQLFIAEVGPIGDILFGQALDAWITAGPIDWRRAAELREALGTEIDDAKNRARFLRHAVWSHTSR